MTQPGTRDGNAAVRLDLEVALRDGAHRVPAGRDRRADRRALRVRARARALGERRGAGRRAEPAGRARSTSCAAVADDAVATSSGVQSPGIADRSYVVLLPTTTERVLSSIRIAARCSASRTRSRSAFLEVVFDAALGADARRATGRLLVEWATSWTILLMVSGAILWWPRGKRRGGGVLWPRRDARGPAVAARSARGVRCVCAARRCSRSPRPASCGRSTRATSAGTRSPPRPSTSTRRRSVVDGRAAHRPRRRPRRREGSIAATDAPIVGSASPAPRTSPTRPTSSTSPTPRTSRPSRTESILVDAYSGRRAPSRGLGRSLRARQGRHARYSIHVGAILGLPGRIAACVASLILARAVHHRTVDVVEAAASRASSAFRPRRGRRGRSTSWSRRSGGCCRRSASRCRSSSRSSWCAGSWRAARDDLGAADARAACVPRRWPLAASRTPRTSSRSTPTAMATSTPTTARSSKAAEQVEIVDKSEGQKLRESARAVTVIDTDRRQRAHRRPGRGAVARAGHPGPAQRRPRLGVAVLAQRSVRRSDPLLPRRRAARASPAGALGIANVPVELVRARRGLPRRRADRARRRRARRRGQSRHRSVVGQPRGRELPDRLVRHAPRDRARRAPATPRPALVARRSRCSSIAPTTTTRSTSRSPTSRDACTPARVPPLPRRLHRRRRQRRGRRRRQRGATSARCVRLYTHRLRQGAPAQRRDDGAVRRGRATARSRAASRCDVAARARTRGVARVLVGGARRAIDFEDQRRRRLRLVRRAESAIAPRARRDRRRSRRTSAIRETGVFARAHRRARARRRTSVCASTIAPTRDPAGRHGLPQIRIRAAAIRCRAQARPARSSSPASSTSCARSTTGSRTSRFVKHYAMLDRRRGRRVPASCSCRSSSATQTVRHRRRASATGSRRAARAKASYEWATRLPIGRRDVRRRRAGRSRTSTLAPERSHNVNLGARLEDRGPSRCRRRRRQRVRAARRPADRAARRRSLLHATRTCTPRASSASRARRGWVAPGEWASLEGSVTVQDIRNASSDGTFGEFEGDRIPNRPWLLGSLAGTRAQARPRARKATSSRCSRTAATCTSSSAAGRASARASPSR